MSSTINNNDNSNARSITDSYNVNTGKIQGNGIVVGSNIHIEGDFIVNTIIPESEGFGLDFLTPTYFLENKSSKSDFDDWKNGFTFELPSIMDGLDFKRTGILKKIISRLDDNTYDHALLLVGQSGTSKSNLLKEIMCHYFRNEFIVFYNFGEEEIKDVHGLVNSLKTKLKDGNKILVAVDNIHDKRTAAIFSIIDNLKSYQEKKDNIRFILTGRLPEFDRFIEDRLQEIPEQIRGSIRKLIKNTSLRFEIPNFTQEEIKDFIKKYKDEEEVKDFLIKYRLKYHEHAKISSDENELDIYIFDYVSKWILNETEGYPILVKFVLFGKGLAEDVKMRYSQYLASDEMKLQTMLICAILDRAGIPITESLLSNMNENIIISAYELINETLIRVEDNWKTIHLKWDLELLAYLYTSSDQFILRGRKKILKKSLESIFKTIESEKDRYFILSTLYDSTTIETEENKKLPIDIIESLVTKADNSYVNNLGMDLKFSVYNYYIGKSYYLLKQYEKSLDAVKEALKIYPSETKAIINKGVSLAGLGRYQEAIICYDKAIEINPTYVDAWYHKGNALFNLAREEEGLQRYEEAIICYDEIIKKLDPTYVKAWDGKVYVLFTLGNALFNLAREEEGLQRYEEAIICYDEIIKKKLDPTYDIKRYALLRRWVSIKQQRYKHR
jgi:tetratricopeptide (TPR) repeat protein